MDSKLVTLTPEEEKAWETSFCYHILTSKQGPGEACRRAWRDVQKLFPRLLDYSGCKA